MIDLSNTRAIAAGAMLAYANESLQAVKYLNAGEGESCTYEGPCAIGVNIPRETRAEWDERDDGESISSILNDGLAIGDVEALTDLQRAHDGFATWPRIEEYHIGFLIVTTFYAMGLHE